MAEQLAESEARVEELKDEFNELTVNVRQKERELRQVRRELAPLGQGMAVKTRRDRTVRIRNEIRVRKKSAIAIQRCFRGYRLRQAMFSWYRDYWVERRDDTTGELFYFNTWSEEVKFNQPMEMTLLPHLAKEYDPALHQPDAIEEGGEYPEGYAEGERNADGEGYEGVGYEVGEYGGSEEYGEGHEEGYEEGGYE